MRKMKLTVLSLLALGAMSLASCTGAQGEKGDKGDQGEQGIQGEPGEPGEPGEDGSFWYSGEGAPSSDLGKEGDMYLDTTNSDVYQKGADGWTKIANIKGEDGEDGEDGTPGIPGGNGEDGETAWSSTILPSSGGYVSVSQGSALVGDIITFTITPDNGKVLDSLSFNGSEISTSDTVLTFDSSTKTYTYSLPMVINGFVVRAKFSDQVASEGYVEGTKYSDVVKDKWGNIYSFSSLVDGAPTFTGGGSGTEQDPIKVSSSQEANNILNASVDNAETNFELQTDVQLNDLLLNTNTKNKDIVIDLNENKLTSSNGTSGTIAQVENASLTVKGGVVEGEIYAYQKGEINLEGVTLNSAFCGVTINPSGIKHDSVDDITVNVVDTTINSSAYGISTNAYLGNTASYKNTTLNIERSTISSANLNDTVGDNTGLLVNIPIDVNIKDSVIEGERQALIVRGGDVVVEDTEIVYHGTYFNNPSDDDDKTFSTDKHHYKGEYDEGNRVATSGIVLGDTSTTAYQYDASLTLKNITYINKFNEATSQTSTLNSITTFDTTTSETRTKPYSLFASHDGEYKTTLNIDQSSLAQFNEEDIYIKEGVLINQLDEVGTIVPTQKGFVGTQYYTNVIYNSDGTINEVLSTKGVKFESGEGTESNPFVISDYTQLEGLSDIRNHEGTLYVKLSDSIDTFITTKTIVLDETLNLSLDLNGKQIELDKDLKNSQRSDYNYVIEAHGDFTLNDSSRTASNPSGTGRIDGGRGVIALYGNSNGTFNGGTLTDISRSGGSAVYADPTSTVTVNYLEVYCSNFAIGAQTSKVIVNDGIFVSVSNNTIKDTNGDPTFTYTVSVGDESELNKGKVIGIQGGTSVIGGKTTINEGWDTRTDHAEALKHYKEQLTKISQRHPYTDDEIEKITEKTSWYGLYVAGEVKDGYPACTINGGYFYGESREAIHVGNSNDGGVGNLATCIIYGGTFENGDSSVSTILVDKGKDEYGKGVCEALGGKFLASSDTRTRLESIINSETHEIKEETIDTKTYLVVVPKE